MLTKIEIETDGEKTGKKKKYEEWELKEKVRILTEAEEIKADKECMAALAPYLDKKVEAIESISDLRKMAGKLAKKSEYSAESKKKAEGRTMPDPSEANPPASAPHVEVY